MAGGTIAAGLMGAAATVASGAATITAGQLNMPEAVTLKMKIRNYTRWSMSNGIADNGAGYILRSPSSLMPATEDFLAAHKASGSAGTYGTLTFDMDIYKHRTRVFIMWSLPNNFNFYTNWMAVGLKKIDGDEKSPSDLFDQMYDGKETFFDRRQYYHGPLKDVTFNLGSLVITGRMGSAHKSEAEVTVYPTSEHNFAPAIREEYYRTVLPESDYVRFQADAPVPKSEKNPANLLSIDSGEPSDLGFASLPEELTFHEWNIKKVEGDYYTIRNPFLDKFLTMTDSNGLTMAVAEEDSTAQQWQIELVHSKTELFRINSRKNPKAFLAWNKLSSNDDNNKNHRLKLAPVLSIRAPQSDRRVNWQMLPA